MAMAKKLCLDCGGELVMAFHPSEKARHTPTTGAPAKPRWRCGTCGSTFSAEQLRAVKGPKSETVEQT